MKHSRILAASALLAAALGATACNSDQPSQNNNQTVNLTFSARALNAIWDCWDTATTPSGIYCEERFTSPGVPELANRRVCWQYSLEVSVLAAGAVTETVVASSVSSPPTNAPPDFSTFENQCPFDETEDSGRFCPQLVTPCAAYTNPRAVSQASRDVTTWLHAAVVEPNVLSRPDGCTPTTSPGCGLDVTVNKGDTVIVRARKTLLADLPNVVQGYQNPELTLTGQLTINGVAASSLGTTSSDIVDGSGVVFSYTVR